MGSFALLFLAAPVFFAVLPFVDVAADFLVADFEPLLFFAVLVFLLCAI